MSNKVFRQPFIIEGTKIGNHRPPYVIAEVAQTHEGSLGAAMAFIDLAKSCGADAVKFQTHIASEESTVNEPWRKRFSCQETSRFDYWKRIEFTFPQWQILKRHADDIGIAFISSPFSVKACEWLRELGMKTWKVASGEVHNRQLIDWILATNDPIILSSGLSLSNESNLLMRELAAGDHHVALLHCTTQYPTPASQIGLNVFTEFKKEFLDFPLGLSDHSGQIYPSVVAAYLGADIIEVHLTMHERMFGPDVSSSLVPDRLIDLIHGVRFAWEMRNHPVDKFVQLETLKSERNIFARSLVATRDLIAGEALTAEMVAYKKPGGGLLYQDLPKLLGKRLRHPISSDQQLGLEDFE